MVTKLLLFCKRFPLVLDLGGLVLPLFADDLGDLWVGKAGILSDDLGLMVLTVQNESYTKLVQRGNKSHGSLISYRCEVWGSWGQADRYRRAQ